jgi:hypothetical protein
LNASNAATSGHPEPVLKSKQPLPFEEVREEEGRCRSGDDDLDIDVDAVDGDVSPDNDVDLGGDDDLGVAAATTTRRRK